VVLKLLWSHCLLSLMPQLIATNTGCRNVGFNITPAVLTGLKVLGCALKVAGLFNGNAVLLGKGVC
jgi:hypothetical protein